MLFSACVLLLSSLGALAGPLAPNATSGQAPLALADYLLPNFLMPRSYDISIIPYFENAPEDDLKFKFIGRVRIVFRTSQATFRIRMHANDMTVQSATVSVFGSNPPVQVQVTGITTTFEEDDKHFLDIQLVSPLSNAQTAFYEVSIDYIGNLNDQLEGFYRSSYVNYRGETIWLGVTQFEATGARRAFPCFDEPALKARFTLHIAREPLRDVIANMAVERATRPVDGDWHQGWVWVDFLQSITMPTYLVAFAVHDFGSVSAPSAPNQVSFKVLARREFIDSSSEYAITKTPQILKYFEDFTGVQYDRSMKVDQIALPDFAAGAMENWGLITYREVNLLHDRFFSTTANRQRILTVVTHELAHQWFGNLVTPAWWNEIWLNEGFATYFEYFAAEKIDPTFQLENAFIREQMHNVFQTDCVDSTHPLTTPVDTPASASAAFDTIAYAKGGSIVRFLITLLTSEPFKAGIKEYLETNSLRSVTKEALWQSLAAVVPAGTLPVGITLAQVMNTWVDQPGYPVITATRNYETKAINFQQERFHSTKKATPGSETWYVPITMIRERDNGNWQDTTTKGWLLPNQILTLTSNTPENEEWIILNPRQTGYYRVNYDAENWKKIIATLNDATKWSIIMDINRAQIIDDSMALAKGKYLEYATALATTDYLGRETEYNPWHTALRAFNFIGDRLIEEAAARRQFFQMYLLTKLRPLYSALNGYQISESDGHVVKLKRALILQWACNLGHDECRSDAASHFQEWKGRSSPDFQNPIDPDLRSVVYCHGMRNVADFDFLFARYQKAQSMPSEMNTLLNSLGCAPTVELLNMLLDETIKVTDSKIRFQDTRTAFFAVVRNPMGVNVALDFLVNKFAEIKITYQAFGSLTRLFATIAEKLNTVEQKSKLEKFLTDNPSESDNIKRGVEAAIATVEENIAWLADNRNTVLDFFEDRVKGGAEISIISPIVLLLAALVNYWL